MAKVGFTSHLNAQSRDSFDVPGRPGRRGDQRQVLRRLPRRQDPVRRRRRTSSCWRSAGEDTRADPAVAAAGGEAAAARRARSGGCGCSSSCSWSCSSSWSSLIMRRAAGRGAAADRRRRRPLGPMKTIMLGIGGGEDSLPVVGWVVPLAGPNQFQTFKLHAGRDQARHRRRRPRRDRRLVHVAPSTPRSSAPPAGSCSTTSARPTAPTSTPGGSARTSWSTTTCSSWARPTSSSSRSTDRELEPPERRGHVAIVALVVVSLLLVGAIAVLIAAQAAERSAPACGGCGRAMLPDWTRCMFCGWQPALPVPRLEFMVGPLAGQTVPLRDEVTTIGSVAGNTVVLSDPAVSRKHLGIRRVGDRYELADLGLDQRRLRQRPPHGQEDARPGRHHAGRQHRDGLPGTVGRRTSSRSWAHGVLFRDSHGRDGHVDLSPTAPLYVGRALDCAVRTDDAMVSRKHSMIRMENGRFYVEDLGIVQRHPRQRRPHHQAPAQPQRRGPVRLAVAALRRGRADPGRRGAGPAAGAAGPRAAPSGSSRPISASRPPSSAPAAR